MKALLVDHGKSNCLSTIFVSKPEIDPEIFNGTIFCSKSNAEKGSEILMWKVGKELKNCQLWTSL